MSKVIKKFRDPDHGWVIKKGRGKQDAASWLADQYLEKKITDRMLLRPVWEYTVPKMLSINRDKAQVVQKFIDGTEISRKFIYQLPKEHQKFATFGMSSFLTDMAMTRPVLFCDRFPDWYELLCFTKKHVPTKLLDRRDMLWLCQFADDAKNFIDAKSFSHTMIYNQGDYKSTNVFYNRNKWQIGVIDFEMSDYCNIWEVISGVPFNDRKLLDAIHDTDFATLHSDVFESISPENVEVYEFVLLFYENAGLFSSVYRQTYNEKGYRCNFDRMMRYMNNIEKRGTIR